MSRSISIIFIPLDDFSYLALDTIYVKAHRRRVGSNKGYGNDHIHRNRSRPLDRRNGLLFLPSLPDWRVTINGRGFGLSPFLDRTRGTKMTTLNTHAYFYVALTIGLLVEFVVCILIFALYVLA